MKILSTGDFHFNAGYDDDVLASVNQIIEYVRQNQVDLVAITGDVYDRASDPNSRNIAAECIQDLANYAPVAVVRGNHDAPGDLDILTRLEATNHIYVFSTPGLFAFGPLMIHMLPWFTKARWQALHPETGKEEGDRTVSQMLLDYVRGNVALNSGVQNILVGHCTIAGAKAQNHQQMGADGVTFGMYDLEEAGIYAALLGHIHLRQTFGTRFFYNGSVAALDYGETPDKYFSVLDTATGNAEWIKLKTVHRQDINACWTPTGIKVENDLDIMYLITGARVRANLRVEGGDNVEQAKAQLEAFLQNLGALEYKINPQIIPVSRVRAVDLAKAVGMSDKLRQYWIATEAPDEATQSNMLDKLAYLEDVG